MKLLAVLLLVALASTLTQAQPSCPVPADQSFSSATTVDLILIKAPLQTYTDALNTCRTCFGDGWQLGNETAFYDTFHKSTANVSQANYQALVALLTNNVPIPASAWFGYQYADINLNECPEFGVIDSNNTNLGLGNCTMQQRAICTRSKLVYNALGSPCDNNLQLCQRGSYCNAPAGGTGTCVVDTICYPTNPCQAGLVGGYTSNPLDAYCTVNPSSPGGYTCDCGYLQAVTIDPSPQTCFECPSANPCAVVRCPENSSCDFQCGDRRGAICRAPNGTVVNQSRPSNSPSTAPSPTPGTTPSTVPASTVCQNNPCGPGTCQPTANVPRNYTCACNPGFVSIYQGVASGPTCIQLPGTNPCDLLPCGIGGTCQPDGTLGSYTCTCFAGFTLAGVSGGGTCVPRPVEPYHTY